MKRGKAKIRAMEGDSHAPAQGVTRIPALGETRGILPPTQMNEQSKMGRGSLICSVLAIQEARQRPSNPGLASPPFALRLVIPKQVSHQLAL
jgi:hypothetical protein